MYIVSHFVYLKLLIKFQNKIYTFYLTLNSHFINIKNRF